jgi:hypothetical protein
MKKAGLQLGMSSDEIDTYIEDFSSKNIQRRNKEVALADTLNQEMGLSAGDTRAFMDSFAKDLTDE